MEFKDINNLKQKINKVSVLIIGDLMLDEYLKGTVARISPEAPVPVLNLEENQLIPGGAANVAMNVAGLGAKPVLVGVVGNDIKGEQLKNLLSRSLTIDGILTSPQRRTTVKTRVTAHQQQIVRIDQEDTYPLEPSELKKLWTYLESILPSVNIVIVSDYNKGLLSKTLLTRLITTAKSLDIPIIIDPKGTDFRKYKSATMITPNKQEFATVTKSGGIPVDMSARELIKKLQLKALLVTLGEKGMRLFEENKNFVDYPASARRVYDVTGAGDTVIAVLSVLLAAGYTLNEAAKTANAAAGMVVEDAGTTAVEINKLVEYLSKNNKS